MRRMAQERKSVAAVSNSLVEDMRIDDEIICNDCFKIICKQCGWEASDTDVKQIQSGIMTACPECGWSP